MPEIQLRDAYAFRCPKCDQVTFVLPVQEPITVAERVEIAADEGIAPDDVEDCWERMPERVVCELCLAVYDVAVPPGEDGEGGEVWDDDGGDLAGDLPEWLTDDGPPDS